MPAVKRIMLDSNVHDLIIADQRSIDAIARRIEGGELKLISTHVQRDELSLAPETKRAALMEIYKMSQSVPTSGAMWDVSRWDESTWGSRAVHAAIDAMIAGNSKHAEDALIAATANGEADVLVTDESRLASKIRRAGLSVEVWSWGQFVEWLDF
jgi:hypothetical protein